MESRGTALLVSRDDDILKALERTLDQIGIDSAIARNCRHARTILEQPDPPELVFSDAILPDGTCAEVIDLAAQAAIPAAVIVISTVVDYKLYMDSMDAGAADFVMPPFSVADIAWVVSSVREKRGDLNHQGAREAPVETGVCGEC